MFNNKHITQYIATAVFCIALGASLTADADSHKSKQSSDAQGIQPVIETPPYGAL